MIHPSLRIKEQTRVLLFSVNCAHCPFSVNQSEVVLLNVCLSTKCWFKKKKIWLLTEVWVFFNVWVTVRSTVQNSLSASLSAGNCQWQKQNYEYFFFFLYGFQNLTTDKLHSFLYKAVDSALSAFFKRMKVSRSVGSSVSWALCSPTLGSTSSPQCTLMW